MRTWWSPLRQLSVFLTHSDERLEPINGYQRVNHDFVSKEILLVLSEREMPLRRRGEGRNWSLWRKDTWIGWRLCCRYVFEYWCCKVPTAVMLECVIVDRRRK